MILTGWTTGWSEDAVTWSGQPNLATLANGAVVNSVASNFLLVCTWFQPLRSASSAIDHHAVQCFKLHKGSGCSMRAAAALWGDEPARPNNRVLCATYAGLGSVIIYGA